MEKFKKVCYKLLFPKVFIIVLLIFIAIPSLVCSMIFFGSEHILSIISYVLSADTLTIVCVRIPDLIDYIKDIKNNNKLVKRLTTDVHLRINISLYGALIWNGAYAIFQFCLGIYHQSFWFYSMCAYYFMLGVMRFFLVRYTRNYKGGDNYKDELVKYVFCGYVLLIMNIALTVMIFFMTYWNKTFVHHQITTIALAAYTFTTFTVGIITFIKYKKYNSPVYSAAKIINLVAATVSIITLEATMLTSFGAESSVEFKQLMLGLTGGAVSIFVLLVAIIMIIYGMRRIREIKA